MFPSIEYSLYNGPPTWIVMKHKGGCEGLETKKLSNASLFPFGWCENTLRVAASLQSQVSG
ncbi:hypothetical protein BDW66DRAFT_133059 [Aspergillus desertorum]